MSDNSTVFTSPTKGDNYQSEKNSMNGIDKDRDGIFRDQRKSKRYFVPVEELNGDLTEMTGLRKTIFMDRYSLKDEEGKPIETHPEQMWRRVAKGIAQFEPTNQLQQDWEDKFYNVMKDFKFVPGGRILSGAGTGSEVTFFNCYVIPSPKDSRGGIMENITHTVEIQSRGGGVGVNLSSLRPSGARVRKVNGTSSGPVNWASLYSTANHDVIQQGGSRRGALMLMLNDWHPDVIEFIKVKEDLTKIPGANLSVCVSNKFMDAVKNDSDWEMVFPDFTDPDYDTVWNGDIDDWRKLGKEVKVYNTVKARLIWDMICEAAWRSAEPGLHFLERSNEMSNTWYFEKLIATNPCGEQPLGEWSVCSLGALNLTAYVKGDGSFDFEGLGHDSKVAMRFLDNVVDANFYFYPENQRAQMEIRRTGLGTMGIGDAMIKMKMKYGSTEGLEMVDKIYKTIRDNAYQASVEIATEKGPFPKFDREKYLQGKFIQRLPESVKEGIAKHGIRNAVILTQAPTGTTSLLAGVSSGIEPNYDFEFKRTDRTGEHIIYHPLFEEWKNANPDKKERPDYFVSAKDLTPEEHVKVQAAIQYYTDSSISKTCNAPNSFTIEDVKKLYTMAYELGCKGVTFFRDGSRTGVLESVEKPKKEDKILETLEMRHRPVKLLGMTYKQQTPVGTAFVSVNADEEGNPFEVFINIGKGGSQVKADAEALGRLISLSLRIPTILPARAVAESIVEQLAGIGGSDSVGFGNNRIRSLADAVAKTMREHLLSQGGEIAVVQDEEPKQVEIAVQPTLPLRSSSKDLCPSCGQASMVLEEGCAKCYNCGHSKC
jgi:ribonucleoside-diphosphate reductase alpha chain